MLATAEEKDNKLPQFIIIGVSKCGTTAARGFLKTHPNLMGSRSETYFFNTKEQYAKGMDYYKTLFPEVDDSVMLYEKSPSYYKSYYAVDRIAAMNSTIKTINVVCDNVRRTLSRYFHILQTQGEGSSFVGTSLEEFEVSLDKTLDEFSLFLDEIKRTEGRGTFDGLINAMYNRWKNDEYPYNNIKSIEAILISGFYAVYNKRWEEVFPREQMLTVNGNLFATEPWLPLKDIQDFVGVEQFLGRKNFQVSEDSGLPCFVEENNVKCLSGQKGRTVGQSFSPEMTAKLRAFYRPFDEYFAKSLDRKNFEWNFGDDLIKLMELREQRAEIESATHSRFKKSVNDS